MLFGKALFYAQFSLIFSKIVYDLRLNYLE